MNPNRLRPLIALVVFASIACQAYDSADKGFAPIFNGEDFEG